MESLGILESDISEEFVRGSGKGGQKINKTSSVVILTHTLSGIVVRVGEDRSQSLNRYLARKKLCELVFAQTEEGQNIISKKIAKIRKQKARRLRKSVSKRTAKPED